MGRAAVDTHGPKPLVVDTDGRGRLPDLELAVHPPPRLTRRHHVEILVRKPYHHVLVERLADRHHLRLRIRAQRDLVGHTLQAGPQTCARSRDACDRWTSRTSSLCAQRAHREPGRLTPCNDIRGAARTRNG